MLIAAYPDTFHPVFEPPDGTIVVQGTHDYDENAKVNLERWQDSGIEFVKGPATHLQHACANFLADLADKRGARVVPMTEEAVVPSGWANDAAFTDGLSFTAALAASHRISQRRALFSMLNPRWSANWSDFTQDQEAPFVAKQPASFYSEGVAKISSMDELAAFSRRPLCWAAVQMTAWAPPAYVYEEFVEGEQYEITGWVGHNTVALNRPLDNPPELDGCGVRFLSILRQVWRGDRITSYERIEPGTEDHLVDEILKRTLWVLNALRLSWCGYCIELRKRADSGDWVVIDAHARIGDDPGSYHSKVDPKSGAPGLRVLEGLKEELDG